MLLFGPFLALNSYSTALNTPTINPNLLPVVVNMVVQFQSNRNTYTQVIILIHFVLEKCLFWALFGPLIPKQDHHPQN